MIGCDQVDVWVDYYVVVDFEFVQIVECVVLVDEYVVFEFYVGVVGCMEWWDQYEVVVDLCVDQFIE